MLKSKIIITTLFFSTIFINANSQEEEFKANAVTKISDTYPCVSKDGKFIIFSSNRDGDNDLYITNLSDNKTKQITNLAGDESQPNISPDGTKITFIATVGDVENGHREIYISNIDGSNIKRVTNNRVTSFHPKFTPSGDKILYNKQVSLEEDRYEFYTIDIETEEQKLVLTDSKNITFGSFSPDGSKLLFVKWFENMNTEIYIANSDGTEQLNISNNEFFDGWPTWSSNGNNVIFASDKDQKFHFHLYRYNFATKVTSKITEGDRQFIQPTTSPGTVFANSNYSRDSSGQIVSFSIK